MSDTAPSPAERSCCCPHRDARDCIRKRNGDDLRWLLGDEDFAPWAPRYAAEECQCGCHHAVDEDDDE